MLLLPCPPSSLMESKYAWYSGVSGAFWSRAKRPGPPIERHWPLKLGYFESSHAQLLLAAALNAPASRIALGKFRPGIAVLPLRYPSVCHSAARRASFLAHDLSRASQP